MIFLKSYQIKIDEEDKRYNTQTKKNNDSIRIFFSKFRNRRVKNNQRRYYTDQFPDEKNVFQIVSIKNPTTQRKEDTHPFKYSGYEIDLPP